MTTSIILFLLQIVALFPSLSASSDVLLWSIDCGTSGTYEDENGIKWQGDDTLINAGRSITVNNGQLEHESMKTLRVFNSGKKNCYVLKGEKGAKLLIRGTFFYGNYDGKSSPPNFSAELDGNFLDKVVTQMDISVFGEVIYVAKGDSISLCLVQTNPDHYPFISSLEVRKLSPGMYQYFDSDQALLLNRRFAYGADKLIRFPSDAYDRFWIPFTTPAFAIQYVANTASSITTTTSPENPPIEALKHAVTTTSTGYFLFGNLDGLDSTPSPVYINAYFSEVQATTVLKRSFYGYIMSGTTVLDSTDTPITPVYGKVTQYSPKKPISASKATTVVLKATPDSILPPILNAFEIFKIIDYSVYVPASSDSGESSSNSSSEKKKSSLGVIIGAGVPSFLFLVAFVVVLVMIQQKRQRAAMAAAPQPGPAPD